MTKIKVGGIVLGGLAGYLLLSKGINAIERGIKNVCTANQWKNYYKYGKDGNMVPPGYNMHTSMGDNGDMDIERNTSQKAAGSPVSDAIAKAISDVFKGEKAAEEALEGQETVSTEGNSTNPEEIEDCPGDCKECKVDDCPYEYHEHKPGEKKIVEIFSDEQHQAVQESTAGEDNPFYVDDLVDGVKVADSETDEEKENNE